MGKKKYSDADRDKILDEWYNSTKPQSTIAKEYGVSVSTIQKWRKEKEHIEDPPNIKYYRLMDKLCIPFVIIGLILAGFKLYIIAILFILLGSVFAVPSSRLDWEKSKKENGASKVHYFLSFFGILSAIAACLIGFFVLVLR